MMQNIQIYLKLLNAFESHNVKKIQDFMKIANQTFCYVKSTYFDRTFLLWIHQHKTDRYRFENHILCHSGSSRYICTDSFFHTLRSRKLKINCLFEIPKGFIIPTLILLAYPKITDTQIEMHPQ